MLSVALRHRLGDFTLDAAFEAPAGVTALFGRSGSGKTTIVKSVAGLLRPDAGRIVADGVVLCDTDRRLHVPPHRRRFGYVFQESRLFPHLSVAQNLDYGRWFARAPKEADRAQVIDLLGLGPLLARRPGALSGGEVSRVALGRAILSAPRMLLMDEPLAALDGARKAEILPYLERLRDELRLPVLYVSHAVEEVARLATTLVLIEAGRVRAVGPVADVLADPGLAPLLGLRAAGAVITARVAVHEADGLTRLEAGAGPLWLPRVAAAPGSPLRLRILAQDVMIATGRPEGLSALNILPATVRDIRPGDGPGALVRLQAGPDIVLARITRRSVAALALEPGRAVFAVIKSVAIAPQDVGADAAPQDEGIGSAPGDVGADR